MYLRILAIVAIFNLALARALAVPLCALSLAGFIFCGLQYRFGKRMEKEPVEIMRLAASGNPLALGAAAIFALLFVVNSVILTVVKSNSAFPAYTRLRPLSASPMSTHSFLIWHKAA
jgi:uncharacterized membrane protein (DUF4010 family)